MPGSITATLKRINTISGGSSADVLYGTYAPGDHRLFLVQKGVGSSPAGRILHIDPGVVNGSVGVLVNFNTALPGFLDTGHSEKGVLGLAFHPGFNDPESAGYLKFYTYSSEHYSAHGSVDFLHPETALTNINNLAVLREWTADGVHPASATPSRVVLTIAQPQNQHNAGTIAFSPADGYLYWALGDGGGNSSSSPSFFGMIDSPTDGHSNSTGPGAPHGNSQDRTNPLGSMLRINPLSVEVAPDSNALPGANGRYQIPVDNPFTMESNIDPGTGLPYPAWEAAWVDEIFAYGLRNPYRFSIDPGAGIDDPARGRIYLGDAGYNSREEVNLIERGGNYGWVIREGTRSMEGEAQGVIPAYTAPVNPATGMPDTLLDPIAEYDNDLGRAVIGGFVYRGEAMAALSGTYVFGEHNSRLTGEMGILFYINLDEPRAPDAPFTIHRLGIDPEGDPLPNSSLLGFGQGADGAIYALFDNGGIYAITDAVDRDAPFGISLEVPEVGSIAFTFFAQAGRAYRVEASASLEGSAWVELKRIQGGGGVERVEEALLEGQERYFRVVAE